MPAKYSSPDAELHNGAHFKSYRHNPYDTARGKVFYFAEDDLAPHQFAGEAPAGTRHPSLWGLVSFVPYPAEQFVAPPAELPADKEVVRVFIGQLPYFVTDMQLAWLCHTFGAGNVVAYPERIMKRQPNGERLPTGCIHAYCTAEAVHELAHGMHKRMLVDDTGVWHAQTRDEFEILSNYVAAMKQDRTMRVPNRPYDSVVVQLATSTYVPMAPMPLTEMPAERKRAVPRSQCDHTRSPAPAADLA